jgi:hypothetical protein
LVGSKSNLDAVKTKKFFLLNFKKRKAGNFKKTEFSHTRISMIDEGS